MAVFSVLKNFNVFVDGRSQAGKCTVTMPNLQARLASYSAGGIDGDLNMEMGFQVIQYSFVMREYDPNVFSIFGYGNTANKAFTFRGAQENTLGQVVPIILETRGWISGIDHGSWDPCSITDVTFTVDAQYLRFDINGRTSYEIDIINMIRIIDGVDVLQQQRQALGI
jgi:P2 family phage contractile tail tube protein